VKEKGTRFSVDVIEKLDEQGIAVEVEEARLFCNLMRSYLGFLLARRAQLTQSADSHPFMQDPQ
jgi:hypothetical protein